MTDYKPGTVAEIGWKMTNGRERAIFNGENWQTESGIGIGVSWVTDVRPLVVLDLDRPGDAVKALKTAADDFEIGVAPGQAYPHRHIYRLIAQQIEAQTRPPKPPEPTGLGAVVEGREGKRLTHVGSGRWIEDDPDDFGYWRWDAVDAHRVLSEGVQP